MLSHVRTMYTARKQLTIMYVMGLKQEAKKETIMTETRIAPRPAFVGRRLLVCVF